MPTHAATSTPLPAATPTALPTPAFSPTSTSIPYATPDWFHDSVLYEIFVRSYADSNGDGIGDILGITDHLDYIATLGVSAIWLMPIYPSPSVHGYDVTDYFSVNPDYGTLDDLEALVAAAHKRNIRVLLDFVPSHLSNINPIFQDALGNPSSKYSDWFVWTNDKHTAYASFGGNEEMPRFNHYNPEVVDYLIKAALYWLDLDQDGSYTDGIDGFRIDNATFPPQEFFYALRGALKAANPNVLLLGETWVHNPTELSNYFTNQFDALFDFPLYEKMEGNQNFNADGLLDGKGFPALLTSLFTKEAEAFPPGAMPVRFLSNHDTNRIASEVREDPARERLAAAFLAALPDPPMIYYGEEIGMPGEQGGPPYWDNYRREPMDWYTSESGPEQTNWFTPENRWNRPNDGISVEEEDANPASLLNYYRDAFDLRREHPVLYSGKFQILDLQASGPGPWGFLRSSGEEKIVALYNFASEDQQVTIENFPLQPENLYDLLSGKPVRASAGEAFQITLPAASAFLLVNQ
jgi:glycosidase